MTEFIAKLNQLALIKFFNVVGAVDIRQEFSGSY